MLGRNPIKKIVKKYKNKTISELSSAERSEVIRTMGEHLEKNVFNIFVKEDNGGVSTRNMTLSTYFDYLEEKDRDATVGDVVKTLEEEQMLI